MSSPAIVPTKTRTRRNSNIRRSYLRNLGIDGGAHQLAAFPKGRYTNKSPSAVVELKGREADRPLRTFIDYFSGWYSDDDPAHTENRDSPKAGAQEAANSDNGVRLSSKNEEHGTGGGGKIPPKRRLQFNEDVAVFYIPVHHELSEYEREAIWYNRKAFRDMIETNLEAVYQEMDEDNDVIEEDDNCYGSSLKNTTTLAPPPPPASSSSLRYNESVPNLSELAAMGGQDHSQGNAAPSSSSWNSHFPRDHEQVIAAQENSFGAPLSPLPMHDSMTVSNLHTWGSSTSDTSQQGRNLSTDSQTPPTSPLLMSINASQEVSLASPSSFQLGTNSDPFEAASGSSHKERLLSQGKSGRHRDVSGNQGHFAPSPLKGLHRGEAVTPESISWAAGRKNFRPQRISGPGSNNELKNVISGRASFPMKSRPGRRNNSGGQIRRNYLLNLGVDVPVTKK